MNRRKFVKLFSALSVTAAVVFSEAAAVVAALKPVPIPVMPTSNILNVVRDFGRAPLWQEPTMNIHNPQTGEVMTAFLSHNQQLSPEEKEEWFG